MLSAPFFSVVVPTYNRIDILSRSIDSVLNQTFKDFELIIIDNGSTDNTGEWLKKKYNDSRIRYHYQEGTGSPAGPRNTGINLSKGEWVSFLDSDDEWLPNKLKEVRKVTDRVVSVDVICHDVFSKTIGTNETKILRHGPFEKDFYKAMLIGGNRLSTSATTVRRSFLNQHGFKFNESAEYAIIEDYDLWLRLAQKGAVFEFISRPLGVYILNKDSLSLYSEIMGKNRITMLKNHVYRLQTFENNKEHLWKCVQFRMYVADSKSMNMAHATRHIIKLIYEYPECLIDFLERYLSRKCSVLLR